MVASLGAIPEVCNKETRKATLSSHWPCRSGSRLSSPRALRARCAAMDQISLLYLDNENFELVDALPSSGWMIRTRAGSGGSLV